MESAATATLGVPMMMMMSMMNSQQQQQAPPIPMAAGPGLTTTTTSRNNNNNQNNPVYGRGLTERQQFLVFVKILLCYCDLCDRRGGGHHDNDNRRTLRTVAKAVVAECTRRNRAGDVEYMPLQAAVERRLRQRLGEAHWAAAKLHFDAYLARQQIRTVHLNNNNTTNDGNNPTVSAV